MIPGFNKTQNLIALVFRKLLLTGDLPEADWRLLYAQDKTGLTYADFKARMKREIPAAQETVIRIGSVNVVSGDRVEIVVAKSDGALAGTCALARNVEHRDGAVRGAQETHSAHRYSMSISRTRFCCRMIST